MPTRTFVPGQKPLPLRRICEPGWSRDGTAPDSVVASSVATFGALASVSASVRVGASIAAAVTITPKPAGTFCVPRRKRSTGSAIRPPFGDTVALGRNSAVTPAGSPDTLRFTLLPAVAKVKSRCTRSLTSAGAQCGIWIGLGVAVESSNCVRTVTGTASVRGAGRIAAFGGIDSAFTVMSLGSKKIGAVSVAVRRMTVASCVPGTGLGTNVALTPTGSPVADSVTGPLEPLMRVSESGTFVVVPCRIVVGFSGPPSETSATVPAGKSIVRSSKPTSAPVVPPNSSSKRAMSFAPLVTWTGVLKPRPTAVTGLEVISVPFAR